MTHEEQRAVSVIRQIGWGNDYRTETTYTDEQLAGSLLGQTLAGCETEQETERVLIMARDVERAGADPLGPPVSKSS